MSGHADPSAPRVAGTIVRIIADRNFCFVHYGEDDYFCHASALENCTFQQLHEGADVRFVPTETKKGLRAEQVVLIDGASRG